MSQEAFADKCGFARSYMSQIERGRANPSLDTVEILAVALGVEVKVLFDTATLALPPAKAKVPAVQVPFAADGTCFNPSLRRPKAGTFAVGEKGSQVYFKSFDEALDYLKRMKVAKWQRPNEADNWGVVSADRWSALPKKYLTV
jgi:transcriptional regulator with XRE-family HTH domain